MDIKDLHDKWEEKTNKEPKLVLNRIRTPDGTILTSRHRHDYVTYTDKNGLEYMVDGGLDYASRHFHKYEPYEELSVYDDAPFEEIRKAFSWGSYGKNGDEPLKWLALCEMTNEHIEAIMEGGFGNEYVRDFFEREMSYRKQHNITIND